MEVALIVVIYNIKINESKTLNNLKEIAKSFDFSKFELFIYDNSVNSQSTPVTFPIAFNYIHNKYNGGLCEAYNYVLHKCIDKQMRWLLLLDQDTEVTFEYFSEIKKNLTKIEEDENIVGIVPKVKFNSKTISPIILKRGGFIKKLEESVDGKCNFPVTGINSGTVLKVDFINSLGGFNSSFKIDMLDYWYFKMIYHNKKTVYLLKSTLQHNLSVMNYDNVSTVRYANIIKSELTFFSNYSSKIDLYIFKIRLLLRLTKQLLKVKNKKIATITFKYLLYKNG